MACVNLRHGMTGERHGRGMLCVRRPLRAQFTRNESARGTSFWRLIEVTGTEARHMPGIFQRAARSWRHSS